MNDDTMNNDTPMMDDDMETTPTPEAMPEEGGMETPEDATTPEGDTNAPEDTTNDNPVV